MLRRKLIKKGLAKVMALSLAVSMAMPGTAQAAAAQPPLDEAAVEEVYEADGAEETVAAEESAEETVAEETADLTDEGSEAEEPAEEAPAGAEAEASKDEDAIEDAEDEEVPADAEDEVVPADAEEDGAVNEEDTASEAPADTEDEIPAEEDVTNPAFQVDAAVPADAATSTVEYTIKFDLTGGRLADGLEEWSAATYEMYRDGITINAGMNIYMQRVFPNGSTYVPIANRDGYEFEGWVESIGDEEVVTVTYYPTKSLTLYAKWIKVHTVKFDLNGGKISDELAAEYGSMYKDGITVSNGGSVSLQTSAWINSENIPIAVRDGYRLDGWSETRDGSILSGNYYSPTKDTTLYAKWTKVCTVTLDPNSGTWASSYYERQYGKGYQTEKGETFYLPGSYSLSRSGYVLKGWTTTKNGTSVLTGQYTVSKDITLYAKWVKTYKVTFNAGAGYFGSDTSAKTTVLEIEAGKDIGYYLNNNSYIPRNGSKVFLG